MVGSARTTLLLSAIVPAYAGPPESIFEAKNAEMVLGQHDGPVFRDGHCASPLNQETIVTFGEWDVGDLRTEFC
jgi:hypothetical protein